MKQPKTAAAYFINTLVIVVIFSVMQILTAVFGGASSFKLVLAPCLWQCC